MSVELMQLRSALDYWMAMCDQYEKKLREQDQELDTLEKENDRLRAVVAAYESR